MGKPYDFFSRWTRLDEFVAPYNAKVFERVATAYGRTMMGVAAVAGVVMVGVAIAMTSPIALTLLQRAWLVTNGIETQATVVSIVADAPNRHGTPDWATLTYTFETRSGETVSDDIRRAPWEFAGLARGRRIEVLYAGRWPHINLPRAGFNNSGFLAFVTLIGVAFSVHIVLFLVRYRSWRKRAAVSPPQT